MKPLPVAAEEQMTANWRGPGLLAALGAFLIAAPAGVAAEAPADNPQAVTDDGLLRSSFTAKQCSGPTAKGSTASAVHAGGHGPPPQRPANRGGARPGGSPRRGEEVPEAELVSCFSTSHCSKCRVGGSEMSILGTARATIGHRRSRIPGGCSPAEPRPFRAATTG